MNNSWQAYENGLALLAKYILSEHPEYERFHALQTNLLENIKQPHAHDLPELSEVRSTFVANLNSLTQQATKQSFIELCISTSPVLVYLTCTYQAVHRACSLYSGEEEIWPDQCEDSASRLQKRPPVADIVTDISGTATDLYYIDQCVIDLLDLIEKFKACCPPKQRLTERVGKKRIEIREALKRCQESILAIDPIFAEFIHWSQDDVLSVRCAEAAPPPRPKSVSFSPPRDGSGERKLHSPADPSDPVKQEKQQYLLEQEQRENIEPPDTHISSSWQMAASLEDRNGPVAQKDSLDWEMHIGLTKYILDIPGMDDYGTRTDLLAGLPPTLRLPRDNSNSYTDISGLIRNLAPIQLTDGQWAIFIFLENAISRVEGTKLAENLRAMHKKIKQPRR